MRLGRVEFSVSYVVDLDNPYMIAHAQDAVFDDVNEIFKYYAIGGHITTVDALSTDTPEDIPEFLRDTDQEEN